MHWFFYRIDHLLCIVITSIGRNTLISTKQNAKFISFFEKFTIFNLKRYYRRTIHIGQSIFKNVNFMLWKVPHSQQIQVVKQGVTILASSEFAWGSATYWPSMTSSSWTSLQFFKTFTFSLRMSSGLTENQVKWRKV